MENYVWYACYGSNLNEDRFSYYIKGGKYPENDSNYNGCRDKTSFIAKAKMTINHGLYFAEESDSWEDKAVAFLTSNSRDEHETKCVLYKVTTEQFIDIFTQENGKTPSKTNPILLPENLKSISPGDELMVGEDNENEWYGRLLRLNNYKGCPVYTFTSKTPDDTIEAKEPGGKYLNVIGKGLLDNFELSEDEVAKYLFNSNGIRNSSWTKEIIALLFQPKFKVIATGKRNALKGQFAAQLNEEDLAKYSLVPGLSEVVISYNIKNTPHIFKTAVKIQKYPKQDNGLADGFIALDQTIRDAIGCDKKIDNLDKKSEKQDVNDYTVWMSFPKYIFFTYLKVYLLNFYKKLTFDKQLNIVRVFKATPNDMEINICRLSESTMQSIGIEDGDKIIIKSTTNKIYIRALTMSEQIASDRKDEENLTKDGGYDKFLGLTKVKLKSEKLAMIFIDYDARQELGIQLGDPVTIYRSNWFAIGKNIQAITIPLLLAFLGIGLKLKDLLLSINIDVGNEFVATVLFYLICSLLLIWINLQPIRKKFK